MKCMHIEGERVTKADHKDTKFEKFLGKIHKQGLTYSDWQNEKYKTTVDREKHKKKTYSIILYGEEIKVTRVGV